MSNAIKVLKHFETPKEEGTYFRLICLTGKYKGEAYFIMGNRIVLGRSEKADVKVHDIKSSREHAEIAKVGKDFVLTDLGSQNGIVVNDLKVKQHVLNENDKIIIGQTVYKFGKVTVKTQDKQKSLLEKLDDEEYSTEEVQEPKSKLVPILAGIILVAAFLLLDSGSQDDIATQRKKSKYKLKEISDPFTATIQQRQKEDKKAKIKLNLYFQKGLREYREGNYYRAISEFNNALSWSPGDPLAEFYLRKTKESLDKTVSSEFNAAVRDEEALKFQSAVVHYCAIIRLLRNFTSKEDTEQVDKAKEGIKRMEESLGLSEGDLECSVARIGDAE